LAKGELAAGVGVQTASPEMVEMVAAAGYDFVYIDCEHGSFQLDTAVQMIRAAEAAGTTPLIRVPNHSSSFIMRCLDAGAMGIIAPNVQTKQQAESIVAAAKFKSGDNGGIRGACPGTRATWHQSANWREFSSRANETTTVWLLIESLEAVENLDEILAVPGIDALMLGPFDLAHAMGFPGQTDHPAVTDQCLKIIEKAKRRGIDVVATLFSSESQEILAERKRWIELGARILITGTDRRIVMRAMNDRLAALRA
jgi:4-hydroxy-2-oxoheptanedioate aldolase